METPLSLLAKIYSYSESRVEHANKKKINPQETDGIRGFMIPFRRGKLSKLTIIFFEFTNKSIKYYCINILFVEWSYLCRFGSILLS
ncbi:hypothetical protein YC2023_071249 [Brassica napus]